MFLKSLDMKSSYKQIGDYIRRIDNRNTDLKVSELWGLSMTKEFRETTSNTVGTDMSTYKVMSKYQFACDFMSTIRVNKLPVVLKLDEIPNLVSPAYSVFEVIDPNKLDPEFLMMWLRRPEFDRYATFKCDGAIRGGYGWNELCETLMPVPDIAIQRKVVREYRVIQEKIELNQSYILQLQKSIQTIFKGWFVDFEFPNANGDGFKSAGGTFISTEFGELPIGWEWREINSICEITSSRRVFESEYKSEGIPFYRGKEITLKKLGQEIVDQIYISTERYSQLAALSGLPKHGDILMTAVGTIGSSYMVQDEEPFYFKDGNVIWFKNFNPSGSNYYLYDYMQSSLFNLMLDEIEIGSTQNAITIKSFGEQRIPFPSDDLLVKYLDISKRLNNLLVNTKKSSLLLTNLKQLLLSRLASLKGEIH